MKPIALTFPRHLLLTISVAKIRALPGMEDRPKPAINLNAAYIQTFGEAAEMMPEIDMVKKERRSMFLRPRRESASVERMKPPKTQPAK